MDTKTLHSSTNVVPQTLSERMEKIIEYRKDPLKFFKEQCYIRHPKKGLVKFPLFPAQEKCIKDFIKHRFNIILKSRQLGISTITAAYCLWKAIFFPHQEIKVVATKKESAQIIIRMAYFMLINVDYWILETLGALPDGDRKQTVELKNGSRMQALAQAKGQNPDTGVGNALSLLVIDECALIPNMDEIWTTIYPTLSQGGDCIVLSTPRGVGNWFHKVYTKAEDKDYKPGEDPFNPIRLMWWDNLDRVGPYNPEETELETDDKIPGGHTNSWARRNFANLTTKQIAQEYACVAGDTNITLRSCDNVNEIFDIKIADLWTIFTKIGSHGLDHNIVTATWVKKNEYQVLTDEGFKNFDGVKKIEEQYLIEITLEDKLKIKITPDHKFIVKGKEVIANDLIVLDVLETKYGLKKVLNIERIFSGKELHNVYDLLEVEDNHRYYTNDILSHNCNFNLSGDTALSPEEIEYIKKHYIREPREKTGVEKDFWIWKHAEPQYHYIVSADIAKGDGSDYSTAQIICVETFEQVAEYRGQIDMGRFGSLLISWAMDYNQALLIPENNNIGWAVIQRILDSNYPNLFWYDKKFKGLVFPDFKEEISKDKKDPGWVTSSKTRPLILTNLLQLFQEAVKLDMGGITIHSSRLLNELTSWGFYGGRLDHAPGKHDDLIFSMAIGAFVKAVYSRISEQETSNALEYMKSFQNNQRFIDLNFGIHATNKANTQQNYMFNGEDISFLVK